jgi:murein DD-endopeptidase MepM/ murein hydrolase activator NlpD
MSAETPWYDQVGHAYEDYGQHNPMMQQSYYCESSLPPTADEQPYTYYFADEPLPLPEQQSPSAPADDRAEPPPRPGRRAVRVAGRRAARRRRSAVLTVAVPAAAVLGIAGAAAATIAVDGASSRPSASAGIGTDAMATPADRVALAHASAEAGEAAQEARRDEARLALQLRTAAAKKSAAEAPRYVLPISFHTGLSALFGQAGSRWMQLHTGIDFPVDSGTEVHAATAGTVSTRWNVFYGNMLMVTAPDRTQTWYCHLSAYKVRSGPVRAGETVAYSGDSGNSTGPHLHFEVHPDSGEAVDPLPWLLAHGLDPR